MAGPGIYTVGGTVQAGGGVYLPRRADEELLALCKAGTYAFVLSARQTGKSSLLVHTARRLAAEGIRWAFVDLTKLGTQATAEQWFLGLLVLLEEQLELKTSAVTWWKAHEHFGATQRLARYFEQVVLAEMPGRAVVFVDEIDTTIRLPFSDDFFAALRLLHNERAQRSELGKLSFVLAGVATPAELIRDPARTPFNVGQAVELTDFTLDEALPLAEGLRLPADEARRVLGEVLGWTGGHPYLTQRLCRIVAEDVAAGGAGDAAARVAKAVERTFLGAGSEQDINLQFARDMLTRRAPEPGETLRMYRDVLRGRPVRDNERSAVVSHLKLAGVVVRSVGGMLQVRNRLYARVFDDAWARRHLPAGEGRGPRWLMPALIAALVLAVILAALLGLRLSSLESERRRHEDPAPRRARALTHVPRGAPVRQGGPSGSGT